MHNCNILIDDGTKIKFQIFQRTVRLGMVQATGYLTHEEEEEKTERMQPNSMM
jgi:hypothetical protein